MAFHFFLIFALLNHIFAGSHATLTKEELYWISAFPNTPMPKFLQDILPPPGQSATFNADPVFRDEDATPLNKGVDIWFGAYWYGYVNQASKKQSTTDKYESEHKDLVKDLKGNKKSLERKTYSDDFATKETLFFFENVLLPNTKVNLPKLTQKSDGATFLPQQLAESMPMSSNKVLEILKNFSLKVGSKGANYVNITIINCERADMRDEEKHCATSLEAFIDLGLSMLGKNTKLLSHELGKEKDNPWFTIGKGVQNLGQKNVICHKMKYPYAVYLCHSIKKTEVYKVPLVHQDGTKANALTVCHKNTSAWNPFHIAFQILKVKPGTIPICHFLSRDTIVWTPNEL